MNWTPRNVLLYVLMIVTSGCAQDQPRINGVSFVAARDQVDQSHVTPVKQLGANYAAVMPFGFIRSLESPEIIHNTQRQWFGETRAGAKQYIQKLNENGIQVMVKPQIWISHGEFTGHMKMKSEESWKALEASYSDFIMTYVDMAAELKAPVFCIGTELEQFIMNRPDYWSELISQIRKKYKGKLTYAANWDEYKRVPFWKQLDFIGVDAYFPVSNSKTPTVEEVISGWQPWKQEMLSISEREGKKILFTEFGYRSVDYTGKEPWVSDRNLGPVNIEAQTNSLKATFETIWDEPWFAGGFIWKWFIEHDKVGGDQNPMYTPQNKPAQGVLEQYFNKQ